MTIPKKIAVVGSSHVTWWELAINRRQIPQPPCEVTFIGQGAMPIWGDFIRSAIAGIENSVDQVFLLLGDLRFGNRVLRSEKFLHSGDTSGHYLAIDKELISDENDRIMLALNLGYLDELSARLGSKLRILFWSSTYRELCNKDSGRYGGREHYRHPVWNMADLVERYRTTAIDTTPLTEPLGRSFFLDASGHPNFKGHAFLYRLLNGQEASEAFESVRADFAAYGRLLFPPDAEHYRVKICGASIAFKAVEKAVRTGRFPMPAGWEIDGLTNDMAIEGRYDLIAYLSGLSFDGEDTGQIETKISVEKTVLAELNEDGRLVVIFWDQWAREIVSKRPEYRGQFLPKMAEGFTAGIEQAFAPYRVMPLSTIAFDDADSLVECGGSFEPCGKGYAALFHLMLSDTLLPTAFARYRQMADHCFSQHPVQTGNAEPVVARLLGRFDGIGVSGDLCGWALDPAMPKRRVPVYFFAGNQPFTSLIADQFHSDLADKNGGDGCCGFSSGPLPLSLLRNLHADIEIRAGFDAEGRFELAGSPIKLDEAAQIRLSLAAIKPWQSEFYAPKPLPDGDWRIPRDGGSLFIAKKTRPENDPSIVPCTDIVLENAVVEKAKRPPAFFKAVVRTRFIGGVYRADGSLETSALGGSAFGLYQLADRTLTIKPTRHIDAECLYGGIIISHYGHFLIESLARFEAFHRHASLPIVFTADCARPSELPVYMKAIFELLNIPLARISFVQETTSFKKLVIPKAGMRWFDYLDTKHQQAMAMQVKKSFGADYPREKQGNIYLSRSKLSTAHDGNIICGEAEFENYLKTEGFTVVYPETLTVKEQVRLFCSARNIVGFVGSAFHTLLLCPDAPEKIVYLHRNKTGVNPQYPLIDKVLHIDSHYLNGVIRNTARIALVDFAAISTSLLALGLVQRPFDAARHDFVTEFGLLSDWLELKNNGKNPSPEARKRLERIADHSLNPVVVSEVKTLLGTLQPSPQKMLVLGPSHVKRLEHALHRGLIPKPGLTIDFAGSDGMPIWHPLLAKQLHAADYDHIFVIVGDFRFGNKTFAESEAKKTGGIAKELISLENDAKLYQKSLATMDAWVAVFGKKIKFLFWDLLAREFFNRRNNKYTIDGQYRHPTWNYDEISQRYKDNIIDADFLKDDCIDRLVTDSSNHFSIYAYLFVVDALQGFDAEKTFKKNDFEYKFTVLDRKFSHLPLPKTYLICDPAIFHRFNNALAKGVLPHHEMLEVINVHAFIAQKPRLPLDDDTKALYLSAFRFVAGENNDVKYRYFVDLHDKLGLAPSRFNIVFFDYLTDYVVELRKKSRNQAFNLPDPADDYALETLQKKHPNTLDYSLDNFPFFDSLFELTGGLPNFKGFWFLLMSAALGQNPAEFVDFYYHYFIKDVFATANAPGSLKD